METIRRPVIVCTEFRGVFFGYAENTDGDTIQLKDAKMAIYWGTTKGLFQLANTGPTSSSNISLPADIEIRKVTAVIQVTEEAEKKWLSA